MHNPDDWTFEGLTDYKFVVQILYFTFTSLSTVGFGDFYPITNEERIFCSFILLFGVTIFSYTQSQLESVLFNTMLDNQELYEMKLDQFFLLLRYLNHTEPIDKALVKDISNFISLRNMMNKNSFLDDFIGQSLLN